MSAKDRPGCPGGGMVLRLGTATCLIVRGLSTSVVLRVVLNFYHQIIKQDCSNSLLKECKTEERDIHLILLSSFGQLCNRIITWFKCVPLLFFEQEFDCLGKLHVHVENLSNLKICTWERKEGNRQTDNVSVENKILLRSNWFISQGNHNKVKYLSHSSYTFFKSSQPLTQGRRWSVLACS